MQEFILGFCPVPPSEARPLGLGYLYGPGYWESAGLQSLAQTPLFQKLEWNPRNMLLENEGKRSES